MALVALDGTPLVAIGLPLNEGAPYLTAPSSTLCDAAKEACIMVGYVRTEDGASHTIDTTGSSALGWLSGAVTFANAGSTVKVGLASVNTTTGPPVRAVNVADVITFDVSKSLAGGGGGIAATSWQTHVPDSGTKTIANGDVVAFAVQMTALGGADAVNINTLAVPSVGVPVLPVVTQFVGAAYGAVARVPNAIITFSDGALGFFYGSAVASTFATSQNWNSGSALKEYGNYLKMSVPAQIYGLLVSANISDDADIILYSDPLGTPIAEKTVSVDANAIGIASANRWFPILFPTPFSSTANQALAAIMKPTTVTGITAFYKTFSASNHQKTDSLGTNAYAVNRASGAFAAQNSNKDRFAIGLLVGAFDAGGAAGLSAHPLRGFVG